LRPEKRRILGKPLLEALRAKIPWDLLIIGREVWLLGPKKDYPFFLPKKAWKLGFFQKEVPQIGGH